MFMTNYVAPKPSGLSIHDLIEAGEAARQAFPRKDALGTPFIESHLPWKSFERAQLPGRHPLRTAPGALLLAVDGCNKDTNHPIARFYADHRQTTERRDVDAAFALAHLELHYKRPLTEGRIAPDTGMLFPYFSETDTQSKCLDEARFFTLGLLMPGHLMRAAIKNKTLEQDTHFIPDDLVAMRLDHLLPA